MKPHYLVVALIAIVASFYQGHTRSIVVASSGPSVKGLTTGTVLVDGSKVTLGATDKLTLLDEHGTRLVVGPAHVVIGSAPETATSLEKIALTVGERRPKLGGTRFKQPQAARPRPSAIWMANIDSAGRFCLPIGGSPVLWRADPSHAETVTVRQGELSATIPWETGTAVAAWPADIPIVDGASYEIRRNSVSPVLLTLRIVNSPDIIRLARSMADAHCDAQLELLLSDR